MSYATTSVSMCGPFYQRTNYVDDLVLICTLVPWTSYCNGQIIYATIIYYRGQVIVMNYAYLCSVCANNLVYQ